VIVAPACSEDAKAGRTSAFFSPRSAEDLCPVPWNRWRSMIDRRVVDGKRDFFTAA
jgi:hypothetical protein